MHKLMITLMLIGNLWIILITVRFYGRAIIPQILAYIFISFIGAYSLSHVSIYGTGDVLDYFKTANQFVLFLSLLGIGFIINCCAGKLRCCNLCAIIIEIILFIILLVPLILLKSLHYSYITKSDYFAFLQTNVRETFSFVKGVDIYSNLPVLILFIIIIVIGIFIIIKAKVYSFSKIEIKRMPNKLGWLLLSLTLFISISSYFSPLGTLVFWRYEYSKYIQETKKSAKLNYESFIASDNTPETIVFIIGESLSRDYMSAYGYDVVTTPNMDKYIQDSTLLKLDNSYACNTQTILVVPQMLTGVNQYHSQQNYNLVDILKINNYKTWWISNQEEIGLYDSPVSVIAHRADSCQFRPYQKKIVYDEELLPSIKQALLSTYSKKAIFIQLIGSHSWAQDQYPNVKPFLRDCKYSDEKLYHYENSILYNDHIIHEILKMFDKNENTIMLYVSDHGDNPSFIRDNQNPKFELLKIPALIYLSPQYKDENVTVYSTLKKNLSRPWSNDLSFDLILGLMGIHKTCYDSTLDISSPEYQLTEKSIKLMNGKYIINNCRE